ncbi:MAG: hypothetical protein WCP55_10115, partial [Lentisphaerota bacterium]
HNIVFGASTKSSVRLCQSIGRGLRMRSDKDTINIIDIHHNTEYSKRHYERREEIYSEVYQINNIKVVDIKCQPTTELPVNIEQDDEPDLFEAYNKILEV